MVLQARDRLKGTLPRVAARVTPQLLSIYFRYVRNLSLIERRLTPDLYALVVAAKQTAGDDFALALAETAREYPYMDQGDAEESSDDPEPVLRMGDGRADVPGWGTATMVTRLPGQALSWRPFELRPRPPERDRQKWRQRWNPFGMCSWPPEDDRIESFQRHVRDQAKAVLGADLARSEKFTTSVMDGLDIRETLRNWHTGDLYVKVMPAEPGVDRGGRLPVRRPGRPEPLHQPGDLVRRAHGGIDPRLLRHRPHEGDLIGPGIAQAEYGGAFFLFPPRPIPDIWIDPRLDFADTLEERLLAGAFLHSRERHVAVVSPRPPSASWRRLARRFGRKIVHLPLKRFGGQLVERLRRSTSSTARPSDRTRPTSSAIPEEGPHDLARPGPDRAGRPSPCPPRPSRPPSMG